MSEAELHQIRLRLHQGELQKAARGELRQPLPVGLARGPAGEIVLNPDEEVQARLLLVFSLFRTLQSARAVMKELRRFCRNKEMKVSEAAEAVAGQKASE